MSEQTKKVVKKKAATASPARRKLTLADIEAVQDITEKEVPVEEWGGYVVVRSVSKRQMRQIRNESRNATGDLDENLLEQQLFLEGLVDPKLEPEDYERLLDKSSSAMDTVLKAIIGTSNLGDKSVKEEEKKFRSR